LWRSGGVQPVLRGPAINRNRWSICSSADIECPPQSQRSAIESIGPKIGGTSQTLLGRVKRDEVDSGEREGVTTSERERLKALAREVKELRRANEILKLASAFFAQASSAGAIALR